MSATVTMNPQQFQQRKPVPAQRSFNDLRQQNPQQEQQPAQHTGNYSRPSRSPHPPTPTRSPNPSSNAVFSAPPQPPQPHHQTQYPQQSRRTLSNATTSTASTNNGLSRAPTTSTMPRRSTSSRSNGSASPTSYVALMRKQKGTVWCDRAQSEDPRVLASQRAAKMRAAMEVAGRVHPSNRISTSSTNLAASGGIRSKIRHPGALKASTFTGGGNLSGAGVPIRLSATEVDENDSDEDNYNRNQYNGSGRSSFGSGGPRASNSYLNAGEKAYSNGHTPPSAISPQDSIDEETPMPTDSNTQQNDYFGEASESTTEVEKNFGGIGGLPQARPRTDSQRKTEEELRRRGSVDDRAMTMSGVRLFVANPDLSD